MMIKVLIIRPAKVQRTRSKVKSLNKTQNLESSQKSKPINNEKSKKKKRK